MWWHALVAVLSVGGCAAVASFLVRACPPRRGRKAPDLLKKRFPYAVDKIAHRGGSLIGPENTIFTFRRAVDEGKANMLELDVHESADGEIIVFHDADLERACGDHRPVGDLVVGKHPGETLPQLLRKILLHFKSMDRGSHYEATSVVPVDDSTRVCLLAEVFNTFPGVPLHIDIKSEGADFTRRVMQMIEDYKRESITFVGSSNWRNQKHIHNYFTPSNGGESAEDLREKRKRFRIFAGPLQYALVQFSYLFGVLPLVPLSFDVYSIPLFTSAKRRAMSSCLERFVTFMLNSPVLWEHLQHRGILVIGWVLNDQEEFVEASKWPINGIMTDDPLALNIFMTNHDVSATMNLLHAE